MVKKEYIEILRKIKPSPKERAEVKKFLEKLEKTAKEVAKPFNAYPLFVGSIAKNTWLKGSHDIDLFIVFKHRISKEELEKFGLEIGTEIVERLKGRYHLKYAEHPYVHAIIENFEIDIVPCYEIEKGEKIISAVDRSPLHYKYVTSKLTPSLCDEVRLLKYFCKIIGVYGSDVITQGVSGYLCELLIIQYGNFERAIKEIAKWSFGEYIDIENISSKKEAIKRFKGDALIVIDPIDKNRNVAANLSAEKLFKLIKEAKKFTETKKFPEKKEMKKLPNLIEKLKKQRETFFIGIEFEKEEDDILDTSFPQLRNLEKKVVRFLKEQDFLIVRSFSFVGKRYYIIIESENKRLPKIKKRIGPLIFSKENVERFLDKYKEKVYIEGNKLCADVKREFQNLEVAIENYFKKRKEEIPKGFKNRERGILDEEMVANRVKEDKELNLFLREKYCI